MIPFPSMWNIFFQFFLRNLFLESYWISISFLLLKYRLHESITVLFSLAHELFENTTRKVVADLHDAERGKRQRKRF